MIFDGKIISDNIRQYQRVWSIDQFDQIQGYCVYFSSHPKRCQYVCLPVQVRGDDLSFLQNLRVGNDYIDTPSTSLAVASNLATTIFGLLTNVLASCSRWGAKCMQRAHFGPQKYTSTYFEVFITISLKDLPTTCLIDQWLDRGIGSDLQQGDTDPFLTADINDAMPSAVILFYQNRYFFFQLERYMIWGDRESSIPQYFDSFAQAFSFQLLISRTMVNYDDFSAYYLNAQQADDYSLPSLLSMINASR